jgi:hypothetical protein
MIMRKMIKSIFVIFLGFVALVCVACEKKYVMTKEKISLAKTVLSEVEFENSEKVKLSQQDDEWIVSGEIESMSAAQKNAFGVDDVTHVVVVKFEFDKERTIDYFKIEGETTKVYSSNKDDKNYVGSLTELLDNDSSEDAFCYLILSANTKEYKLVSKYTDDVESEIKLKIEASLVSASAEN